ATREWHPGSDLSSGQKFREFVMTFKPTRPRRATRDGRLDWRRMSDHLRAIYRLRNRELHEGIPIPAPMCEPPYVSRGIANEIPYFNLGRHGLWRAPPCCCIRSSTSFGTHCKRGGLTWHLARNSEHPVHGHANPTPVTKGSGGFR